MVIWCLDKLCTVLKWEGLESLADPLPLPGHPSLLRVNMLPSQMSSALLWSFFSSHFHAINGPEAHRCILEPNPEMETLF